MDCDLVFFQLPGEIPHLWEPLFQHGEGFLFFLSGVQRVNAVKGGFNGSGLFGEENRLFENLDAVTNIHITTGKTKEEIAGFLKEMELDDVAGKPVSEYSGGMKRRVAIARALLAEYDILIMDEPLQGLDAETKEKVATVIKMQTAGKTVLFVTHDEKEAEFFEAECMELV